MVVPYKKKAMEFEKVVIDEWLQGHIAGVEVKLDQEKIYQGITKKVDLIRYILKLPAYQYEKKTRFFTISLHEKSGLYAFLKKLIPDLMPECDGLDLEGIKGMGIKVMFDDYTGKDGNVYQTICNIKPLDPVSYKDILIDFDKLPPAENKPTEKDVRELFGVPGEDEIL
jgi:hypothetical protein